jgi:hypothetical protein
MPHHPVGNKKKMGDQDRSYEEEAKNLSLKTVETRGDCDVMALYERLAIEDNQHAMDVVVFEPYGEPASWTEA